MVYDVHVCISEFPIGFVVNSDDDGGKVELVISVFGKHSQKNAK